MKQLLIFLLLTSTLIAAPDISGKWRNTEKPITVSMVVEDTKANGTIIKHEERKEFEGVHMFRNLQYNEKRDVYTGTIYIAARKKELPVIVSLNEKDELEATIKIGVVKRTLSWIRPEKV